MLTSKLIDENTADLTIKIPKPNNAYIYSDYITISVDNPDVTLSSWTTNQEASSFYDKKFKTTKKIFKEPLSISLQAHLNRPLAHQAHLHLTYYATNDTHITKKIIPLPFVLLTDPVEKEQEIKPMLQTAIEVNSSITEQEEKPSQQSSSYANRLSLVIIHTNSLWVRLLLVMLLGILMSLTPCIYPMIPITVGILQSQGSKSFLRNILLSLSYTLGIATTFALLGLMAAITGQMLGHFMANPVVIIFIVCVLAYLGGAMFGFYEMYIPSFFQSGSTGNQNGSCLSAFLFGVASGSVASPCLSPGLILLLTIVTTLNSKLMGFVLLFMFGVGLSVPLLLIGTFSSSLSILPRAGFWMVEIKKCFGFMLFGMCFYFLRPILPAPLLLSMLALFLLASGIFYLYSENKKEAGFWKKVYCLAGICLVALSIVVATLAYKTYLIANEPSLSTLWQTDYTKAVETAQQDKKKLFIDIGATFCSMCTAIDKRVLAHPAVLQALEQFSCVKVNGSDDPENIVKRLQEKNTIHGFPTFLLIDPKTGLLIKRWGSELYDVDCQAFAQELLQLARA